MFKYRKLLLFVNRAVYIASAAMLMAGLVLTVSPKPVLAYPGAIWTNNTSCGDPQDVNSFNHGDHVYIHGENFNAGDYNWAITGQPGSLDPSSQVAHGIVSIDSSGLFCFNAYTVAADDGGEYKANVGTKNDNYHVDMPADVCPNIAGIQVEIPEGMIIIGGNCVVQVLGCTDPTADNYNAAANVDNGTCYWLGCMDETADNYDATATQDDGSCYWLGCMDPDAENYDANATVDDGSCTYPGEGCMDPTADNYDPTAEVDDGSCYWLGCMDETADNYDAAATQDDGSCYWLGCMDETADNYDATATQDDGSCYWLGCMDETADNYDATATQDDGSCYWLGCMDETADNYDATATQDDGSCYWLGCMDPDADNYDEGATVDDGTCYYLGCMDPEATNYDPGATVNDQSCVYEEIDVCPNIEGNQAELPAGYHINGKGECVKNTKDVCPNIDGKQAEIPAGMELVDGNCVTILPPPVGGAGGLLIPVTGADLTPGMNKLTFGGFGLLGLGLILTGIRRKLEE